MEGSKDSLRDISFDGKPSGYRDFRRKTLLAIAGLEDKHAHLAGPRLLSRLSGEAWRATEHLNIAELRQPQGFLTVIKALDEHYKYLPETELHESIDEFLFALKRRQGEGATAFTSRFRTQLARVETLISQEREMTRQKRRRLDDRHRQTMPPVDELHESELEETASEGSGPHDQQPGEPGPGTPAAAGAPEAEAEPQAPAEDDDGEGTHRSARSARSQPSVHSSLRRKTHSTRGSYDKDWAGQQVKMQQMLGTLEMGHVKPKPIFPQSVLGHLFMRKYGLSREQRAQVVRATNGSSRFQDIERILRASDFEERRNDDKRHGKPPRRDAYVVQQSQQVFAAEASDSSSMDADMLASADSDESQDVLEVAEAQNSEDDDVLAEIEEVYELQKKAKEKFKKSFKTYRETKKRVKELKKSRQPYYPVVALNQPSDQGQSSSAQVPLQKSKFQYDKKPTKPGKSRPRDDKPKPKREEAHMTETQLLTSFQYMVEATDDASKMTPDDVSRWSSEDALLASIPEGHAILDTGCTTSVVGQETSYNLTRFLEAQNLPKPVECELPPVELKGFKGEKIESTKGLRWHVKIGDRWGTVTTYVIPGQTPFLLSRRVLEGMDASLHIGRKTITSEPHNMYEVQLRQAANGHLLLPLFEVKPEFRPDVPSTGSHEQAVLPTEHEPNEDDSAVSCQSLEDEVPVPVHSPEDHGSTKVRSKTKSPRKPGPPSTTDRRKAFQHIVKNTKNGQVDLSVFQDELYVIFGNSSTHITDAQIGYKPKLERIPRDAQTHEMYQSVVTLNPDGVFQVTPWTIRPAGVSRRRVDPVSIALFVHRPVNSVIHQTGRDDKPELMCLCCSEDIPFDQESDEPDYDNLEILYEETDWTSIDSEPLPQEVQQQLLEAIESVRKTQAQLVMTRVLEEPRQVRDDLKKWLGPQAELLDKPVHFLEVFTGKAPLAKRVEQKLQAPSIRIGLDYGHNLDNLQDRRMLMQLIVYVRPRHVWFSFPCGCWGPWSRFNIAKGGKCEQGIKAQRAKARRHLHAVSEAWSIQVALGGHCHAENPLTSEAWCELRLGDVYDIRIDQCALGLRCPKTKLPVLKPTRIVTTCQEMAETLQSYRCDHKHDHGHLEGKYKGVNLSKYAETYPTKFCNVVSAVIEQEVTSASSPKLPLAEHVYALDSEVAAADLQDDAPVADEEQQAEDMSKARAKQIVLKLHINTGHASPEQMMRLANRCQSSQTLKNAIREFSCPVCKELKLPSLRRAAAMPHAEHPNQIVGVDFVQVEISREEGNRGLVRRKFSVLTCVCLATDFCQQIIVPTSGSGYLSKAFHQVWTRAYGAPKIVYMDPAQLSLSKDFQLYLEQNQIQLLHCATESHWQLGRIEVANRVLRDMARRVWRTTSRPVEEVIETCASVRNQLLRKSGFSPSQWFLGQDPKMTGWMIDVETQHDSALQSQILTDPSFHAKVRLKEEAAQAFHEAHAKDVWRRAIAARNRPLRGPYFTGQLVYFFRTRDKGHRRQLKTRNGFWTGPARVIGTESSTGHFVPRIVWVTFNGYLYKCSPEGLRPVPEDESEFRKLAQQMAEGRLHPDVISAEQTIASRGGMFSDISQERPADDDFELSQDLEDEPDDDDNDMDDDENNDDNDASRKRVQKRHAEQQEPKPRSVRFRFYKSDEYWKKRALGAPPSGPVHEGIPAPNVITELPTSSLEPPVRRQKHEPGESSHVPDVEYAPTTPADSPRHEPEDVEMNPNEDASLEVNPPTEGVNESNEPAVEANSTAEPAAPAEASANPGTETNDPQNIPVPDDDEDLAVESKPVAKRVEHVLEVSLNVLPTDISDNPNFLWGVLDECLVASPAQTKLRRVEVNFRKLNPEDKKLFEKAMQKEWNSWIENKVTTICKSRGISPDRIIKARWVLVWKKSSDPDDKNKTPKARLVLVGWQDPELGKIATDSPTLRKESKSLVLSICASKHWKLWGADIKTAFLSGDPSSRDIYFKPPPEIREWMQLEGDDLMRLEKAAYGLAEAPRAWFLRLTREMKAVGLVQSALDPCLFTLKHGDELLGVCGVHVDDILGGGSREMDNCLNKLKANLPFGDYRTFTIRYTGVEIRQNPNNFSIEVGQETYIDSLKPVETKPLGTASTPLPNASILRQCAGQLAWVSNSTRPDQAFLSSYLQGMQDKGTVSHVQLYNKALREMKERKFCLKFPSDVPIDKWRIMAIADAGWGTRGNGESQGGYVLCLCHKDMIEQKPATCWIVDWSSKKLRRAVRSSVAAETLAGQNGLDAIEMFQALIEKLSRELHQNSSESRSQHTQLHLWLIQKGFTMQ